MQSYFRNSQGTWLNIAALAYTLFGYGIGVAMLLAQPWWINLIGVLLTAHALIYAAYFIHEFAHQNIFKNAEANNGWGTLITSGRLCLGTIYLSSTPIYSHRNMIKSYRCSTYVAAIIVIG